MSANLPQDIRYTDLSPDQVSFLQTTVPGDAAQNGFTANITVTPQANRSMTVTIHFLAAGPNVAVLPGVPASPSGGEGAGG